VDEIHDTEEIVVKPLNRQLKALGCYAGATVMGDGRVALILDVPGMSNLAQIMMEENQEYLKQPEEFRLLLDEDRQSLLLFTVHPQEYFAIPSALVSRLETFKREHLKTIANRDVVQYGNRLMPVIRLEKFLDVKEPPELDSFSVVVMQINQHTVGILATEIIDIIELEQEFDTSTVLQDGLLGSAIYDGHLIQILDAYKIISHEYPEWFERRHTAGQHVDHPVRNRILLAEDSSFIRSIERSYLESAGFKVLEAENGEDAFSILQSQPVDVVVTDIEMPKMDGLELVKQIRSHPTYKNMPVIALTSLDRPEEIEQGKSSGMDAYLTKLNRDELISCLKSIIQERYYHETVQATEGVAR